MRRAQPISALPLAVRNAVLLACAALGASACCADPWSSFPEHRPPDQQYSVSEGVQGDEIYVWECLNGQRVVVYRSHAEWACGDPRRETAACGEKTPIEKKTEGAPHRPAMNPWR